MFATYNLSFPRDGLRHVRLNTDWRGYSDIFGNQPSNDVLVSGSRCDVSSGHYAPIVLSQ